MVNGLVTRLFGQHRKIHAPPVDAGRRAGLEAPHTEGQGAQAFRERIGRRISRPSARLRLETHMNPAAEKSAGGHDNGGRPETQPHCRNHARHRVAFDHQVHHRLLEDTQVFLALHNAADRGPIQRPVSLGAGGAHRRALAGIEDPELNARRIRRPRHGAVKRIDLPHQVALADPPDGGIAGHLPDRLDTLGEQQRRGAHTGRRQRGLGPGVAAANHDYIELFWVFEHHRCSGSRHRLRHRAVLRLHGCEANRGADYNASSLAKCRISQVTCRYRRC